MFECPRFHPFAAGSLAPAAAPAAASAQLELMKESNQPKFSKNRR
jgi:hypothetical protein